VQRSTSANLERTDISTMPQPPAEAELSSTQLNAYALMGNHEYYLEGIRACWVMRKLAKSTATTLSRR
jgi:hypothetical protein